MKNIFVKVAIIALFLASFGLILGRNLPRILTESAPDFTQVWLSARALVTSKEPYLEAGLDYPNAYPPVSELFFIPLALLSYHKALSIFTYLSVISIVGSVFLSIKIVFKKVPWQYFLLFLGLSFLSFPTKFSLGMGQINMIVLFLLLIAVFLEARFKKYFIASGVVLGVAIAIKPIFAFFLIFLAIRKSWKAIYVSLIAVGILIAVTLVFWSPQIWFNWYQTGILPLVNYTSAQIYVPQNQGIFGFLYGYISDFNIRIYLSRAATIILVPLCVYFAFKKRQANLELSFFIITLLLFDITSWQHHFVWLLFPFVVLLFSTIRSKSMPLLALLVIAYFLASWNFRNPFVHPVVVRSTQFYAAIILWAINLYFLTRRVLPLPMKGKGKLTDRIFELFNTK